MSRGTRSRPVVAAPHEVAEALGSPTRETILYENLGKHAYEITCILERRPRSVLDVGGGLGVNLLCFRRLLGPGPALILVDRFSEYT